MKKIISALLAVMVFTTVLAPLCALHVFADNYTVNSVGLYKTVGDEAVAISTLEEGEVYASANVTQVKFKRLILVLAVYKDEELYDCQFKASPLLRADSTIDVVTDPVNIELEAGESITDYTAKIMVCESLNNVRPLCNAVAVSGFSSDDIYDNFSTVVCDTASFEMSSSTEGRKFYDSDNIIVYPNSEKAPYGVPKYEGSNGKYATGTASAQTAYASYSGDFSDKSVAAAFSCPVDSTYASFSDMKDKFFADNLKIYAGKKTDNMTQLDITEWSGSTINGVNYLYARTDKLTDQKYVKIEISNFDGTFSISSFRISTGKNGYHRRLFYDNYSTDDIFGSVDNMSIQQINRSTEYGTLVNCLQPTDNAEYAGVCYYGDFGGANFTYLATMEDHFINDVLAPLHDSSYDRWGAWEDAIALADYNVYVGPNDQELVYLEPTEYYFDRPGQYKGFSVEIIFKNLPEDTKCIYIEVGNPYWSTRIGYAYCDEFIEGPNPDLEGFPEGIDPGSYTANIISVVTPEYTGDVSGDQEIVVCAPNLTSIKAYSWLPEGTFGKDNLVAEVELNNAGLGKFTLPCEDYPKGPIVVRIKGYKNADQVDECQLQLYNHSGISWNQGLSTAPVNKIVTDNNLKEVFSDDFTTMPSIYWSHQYGAKYSSHKIGWGDFSDLAFQDHDYNSNSPFSQKDTYLRINANQQLNRTGLVASMHQDRMTGFAVKAPCYFECRFIAQNAKGTWPAFWLMTTQYGVESTDGEDELDIIEAYGFDYSQPQGKNVNGYHATMHDWGNTVDWDNSSNDHGIADMANLNSGGQWYTDFHTYACYIGLDYTIYYCDNVEIYRHQTLPHSASRYHYWMFNYAIGGISGWPHDLTRYNYSSDMYVDWVRVYGLEENVAPQS